MRKRLTEVGVEKIAPQAGKRLEVFDALTPGLAVRVTETGRKSWSLMYRVAGRGEGGKRGPLRRMTLGQYPLVRLAEARDLARAAYQRAEAGEDPADARRDEARQRAELVFEAILDDFIELHAKAKTKKWRDTERLLREQVVADWRGMPIDKVTRGMCFRLLDRVTREAGVSQAREVRKQLTKMLNWAADRDYIPANPLAGAKMPDLGYVERERVLSMEELRSVWDAAGEMGYPFGSLIRLLILTAQRRGEVANLRREWLIELDGGPAFEVPGAMRKTGRPQVVPLSDPARAILDGLPKWNAGDFLLSTTHGQRPISGFSKAKARAVRLSGVDDWTLHDLRRSAATEMARMQVPQEHIERILGHEVQGVHGTYNRYTYLDEKRAALDLWGQKWS